MATAQLSGTMGLPFAGEILQISSNPYEYGKRRHQQYGLVSRTRWLSKKAIIMLGADAQRFVLMTNQRNFVTSRGYSLIEPFYGGTLLLSDGEQHAHEKRLMMPAFHSRNMGAYLEIMNRVIDVHLNKWGQSGQRGLYPDIAAITFNLATSLMLDIEVPEKQEEFVKIWTTFASGGNSILRVDAPLSAYGRALAAGRKINVILQNIIDEQRQNSQSSLLKRLLDERDEDGQPLSDATLIKQLRLLVFAGFDTTTGSLSWIFTEMLRSPALLERVRAEVKADQADAPLQIEDITNTPYLDALIDESTRMYPQAMLMLRGIIEDVEYEGLLLPKGWTVVLMPAYTHRMPEYFKDPNTFDPERFLPDRNEAKKYPGAWIGFGAGAHACIGEGVARTEIKALLTRLLRRFDIQAVPGQDFRQLFLPLSRPKSDVVVNYQAR